MKVTKAVIPAAGLGDVYKRQGNMRYIEKTGIRWSDEGIDSLELAERKIRQLDQSQKAWSSVQRLLGLERRSPTAKEAQFADRWINEWRFSEDLIREAYERNVDAKGKFSFPYMNSILERWKKEGVETLEQAQNEKKPFQDVYKRQPYSRAEGRNTLQSALTQI